MQKYIIGVIFALGVFVGMESAQAVTIPGDNTYVLDFVANGDGGGNLSNLPVAVYWKWDGNQTLGIRMETDSLPGFGNLWSFNVFCNGSSPGGLDSNGSNNTVNVISAGGALTAVSLGAFAGSVDAIEATWIQPCGGGPFDPSQTTVYIQLTMLGPSGPSDGYRMADYLGQGGTYSTTPDILFPPDGFCATTNGTCALLTFQVQTCAELFPCGNNGDKVEVCHVPPGNPENADTICISPNALDSHLENHEDFCGPCEVD